MTRNTADASALQVGGFLPFSSTDWPGRLCAVVFVQGCPWRCVYCHNPELQARHAAESQDAEGRPQLAWADVLAHLERRVGLLDGVVFSGGEPTLDPALPAAIAQVKALGFAVGLHTAGIAPPALDALLPQLDWVGLDIKADPADAQAYAAVTGAKASARAASQALAKLVASGVDHELRTTWHPAIVPPAALPAMGRRLARAGARHWVLQRWQPVAEQDRAADDPTAAASTSASTSACTSARPSARTSAADAVESDGPPAHRPAPPRMTLQPCWPWPDEAVLGTLREQAPAFSLR